MRSDADVDAVFALARSGLSKAEISRRTGVSRERVKVWLAQGADAVKSSPMRRPRRRAPCAAPCPLIDDVPRRAYAYLLGQYLGDGCISAASLNVSKLRIIACDD